MDLNERIEARRREKVKEALETQKAEANRKAAQKLELEREVQNRLDSIGIKTQQNPVEKPSEKEIEAEVERRLRKAAVERLSDSEFVKCAALLLFGILGFFVAWPLGVLFLIWAILYRSIKIDRHKEEILAEGKNRTAGNSSNENGTANQPKYLPETDGNKPMVDSLAED